jgi:hypothetical protein
VQQKHGLLSEELSIMARPRKSQDSRSETIGVRLTLTEKQELEARAAGMPLSSFLRSASLRRSLPRPIPPVNLQTYQALLQINQTVEQIRQTFDTAANSLPNDETMRKQLALLQDIKTELKEIGKTLLAAAADAPLRG